MLEATKLIVAVKNIETPDERGPVVSTGRLKG